LKLKGKIVVITGAATGIGSACAKLYAKEGGKIVIGDINEVDSKSTIDEIKKFGGEAVFCRCDVSKWEDCKNLIDFAVKTYGRIDILHNNAGIGPLGDAESTTIELWQKVININLSSVFYCSKAAIPYMRKQGGGVILNTASNWGFVAQPGWEAYHASKGGVVMLTRAMSIDYAKYNIRINSICPGYVDTPLLRKAAAASPDPAKEWEDMGKLAAPIDMAYGALFLVSDESSHCVGTCLIMDNGETSRGGPVKDHLPAKGSNPFKKQK
jgi:NAD(P)-dependent dehydrogenase (short-subunit alcohol dehydrogenase family)